MIKSTAGLTGCPVRSIVRAIADAAERWRDADFPPRVRALDAVTARTGYSAPVVEYAFDHLFASLTQAAIERTIVSELGSLDLLDRFVAQPGRPDTRALPAGRVCVISSRTTIGVAIVPAIFALLAKCSVVVKDREDRLVAAFFSTLAEELDGLRDAARAQAWEGERDAGDLETFDTVVVFGNDATLARIASTLPPTTRTIAFGSKASAGYVAREALASEDAAQEIAEGAARDLVLYDAEGCLSLHALFVERGGNVSPSRFAAILSSAVERACVEFPLGARTAQTTAQLAQARDAAAFRAARGQGCVYAGARASYVIVLDPPPDEPPAFLPRMIGVRSVDTPREAAGYLQRHRISLEAIAIAGDRSDIATMALGAGAARIAAFGRMQDPPLDAYHGGRPRIGEFVRWVYRDV